MACMTLISAEAIAAPTAWLSNYYSTGWGSGSWYRAPVTDGYMDVSLMLEDITFTDVEFSITYNSTVIHEISSANVWNILSGLTLDSITTQDLGGDMKKSTIVLSGSVTIGTVEYESENVLKIRLIPSAEGTFPLGLWANNNYPASFKTCDLTVTNLGVDVPCQRKEWNDSTQLITFTDNTSASVLYYYDMNLGTPISNGYFRIEYSDGSTEEIHASDAGKGVVIDSAYGGYWFSAIPDAVSYALIFPEYQDVNPIDPSGGWSVSHVTPEGMIFFREAGHEGLPASSQDTPLTVDWSGIGVDFNSHQYAGILIKQGDGVLSGKTIDPEYVSDDAVRFIIRGGIEEGYYDFYVYKDGLILGRGWFNASIYYAVTFEVKDDNGNPLSGAKIFIPQWGMSGPSEIVRYTDNAGQAVFELAGNPDWGQFYNYVVQLASFESVVDSVEVFAADKQVDILMLPETAMDMDDFVRLATWWSMEYCQWNNYCDKIDLNFDGTVNLTDLEMFADRWLKD
jgi:hypothetical protein